MRLSEAIRLGAMLKPQGFGTFLGPRQFTASLFGEQCVCDGPMATCALGAAYDVTSYPGERVQQFDDYTLVSFDHGPFQTVLARPEQCPMCDYVEGRTSLGNVIVHLNDHHRLTREAIADWVETAEPQLANQLQPDLVAATVTWD